LLPPGGLCEKSYLISIEHLFYVVKQKRERDSNRDPAGDERDKEIKEIRNEKAFVRKFFQIPFIRYIPVNGLLFI
jgi:hypothetical protein